MFKRVIFFFLLIVQVSFGQQIKSTKSVKNNQSNLQDKITSTKSEITQLQNELLYYRNISEENALRDIDIGNIHYEVGKVGAVFNIDFLGNREYGISYISFITQSNKYIKYDRSEIKYDTEKWKEENIKEIEDKIRSLKQNIVSFENTIQQLGDEIDKINKYWSVYNQTLDVVSENIFKETVDLLELAYNIQKKDVGKILYDLSSFYYEADLFLDFKENKESFELWLLPYIQSGMSKESATQMILDGSGYTIRELDSIFIYGKIIIDKNSNQIILNAPPDINKIHKLYNAGREKNGFEFNQSDLEWISNINKLSTFSKKEYCKYAGLKEEACVAFDKSPYKYTLYKYNRSILYNIDEVLPIGSVIKSKNFIALLKSKNIDIRPSDWSDLNITFSSLDSKKIKIKLKDEYINHLAYMFSFEKNNLIDIYIDAIKKINYSQILGDVISELEVEFSSSLSFEGWKNLLKNNSNKVNLDIPGKIGIFYKEILELRKLKLIEEKEKISDFALNSAFQGSEKQYNYNSISSDELKNEIIESVNYYSLFIDEVMIDFLEKDFRISQNFIETHNTLSVFSNELSRLVILSSLSNLFIFPPSFGTRNTHLGYQDAKKSFKEVQKIFSDDELDFIKKCQQAKPSSYVLSLENDPVIQNLIKNGANSNQIGIYVQSLNFNPLDALKEVLKSNAFQLIDLNKIANYMFSKQ